MASINSTDLKNGATFLKNGKPYKVTKYRLIKMGRGGATVRVTTRNLENANVEEHTFSSNVKVEGIDTAKKQLQYLYKEGGQAVFMDPKSFEQFEIPVSLIEEELNYITEGDNADILFWKGANDGEDKPLSIDIPPKVTLKIKSTAPGVKGNSATNVYKPAITENGLEVRVPLFINTGESVVVDTRSGAYVERAKTN